MATPALNTLPQPVSADSTARPPRQSFLYKSIITLYRIFAIVVLYAVLLGILAYAFIMGFYAINTTWAAPVIISASDEKSLDFLQKLVTSRQTLEDLHVDITHQQTTLDEMTKHRASLEALDPELQGAILRERSHDRLTGPQLAALDTQKQADNIKTQAVLAQLQQLESSINKDLAVGFITKSDATTQISSHERVLNMMWEYRNKAETLSPFSAFAKTSR